MQLDVRRMEDPDKLRAGPRRIEGAQNTVDDRAHAQPGFERGELGKPGSQELEREIGETGAVERVCDFVEVSRDRHAQSREAGARTGRTFPFHTVEEHAHARLGKEPCGQKEPWELFVGVSIGRPVEVDAEQGKVGQASARGAHEAGELGAVSPRARNVKRNAPSWSSSTAPSRTAPIAASASSIASGRDKVGPRPTMRSTWAKGSPTR